MLLGNWKNIEELESCLTLEELNLIVQAARDKEFRGMEFYASFKGVDLRAQKTETEDRFKAAQKRAEQRLAGRTEQQIEADEFAEFGIDVEVM